MSERDFIIRPLTEDDYGQVRHIYERGLDTGHASYERHALTWEEFNGRKIMECAFVAVERSDNETVLGWVSAAPISQREVFHGVVEDSIYIDPRAQGRGVAGALLDTLIEKCIELEKWAIHSWIFPENTGSTKLHQSRGFEKAGILSHLAKMPYGELAGQWRDTVIWEKLLPKPETF
ncbi:N-acetyltransferase family protein [Corynebacterium sp. CCM 8835]|uniref:N-acetyltransferase n=1 Tax=Corynebacterium antarcticum TaxID=2800405 RepID=A0A9Q4GPB0_9CORY|nr:GNAT family N-acetyltransferase [Corynebacterium antarcticum]MCK7642873.1 N-acetyltransferase family protein [Corynebacterium antarcticum]MCK7661376.1 N-acetyltransferase family protein [Corynebacterium antarcticum]MCL0246113.1 N-acetyltransferase family protein [Corynebacterium antarcticum]MCX7492362.1 GNAT family N-acetyltransferase [Corynebacterium antarcticum]MCX7538524.1 GNAT family N-acetyltransferase [Corynebacterium antarcticum]